MTPEQIAAKMTPAQVRDLRDAAKGIGPSEITPLGLAVLAALDKGAAT